MSWHPDEAYDDAALQREEAAEVLTPEAVITRLKLAVTDAGSQAEFARRAGTSRSRVCEVLSGRRPPGDAILAALGARRAIVGRQA
ncbi:hypothetical protein GOFOIKOB_0312 [Methylobacterium tardum]|jgi:hypothetical protein|uniref:Uncharacterized protein n=1 Tax=Methylobacterium tardum TaxID=374432 RepID=A0AA37WUQ6_9HYPH|nr:helix-turn-helix transcriptional regulator [Methylobacterium tardum]URD36856.1 helix-turn-helix domain-containing protein [Methylobacterium tardum]GJE47291.1 hypothetical protein GOFOIKOB_0312 [Methylobacterium tardum]GLS71338.1 hypothetical protein GCM10007890_33510 [Methylobacterium tardum]